MSKTKTPEQIARRKAASAARRKAKKKPVPVNDEIRDILNKGFAQLMERYEAGKLTYNQCDNLLSLSIRKKSTKTPDEIKAQIEKEKRKLARLEAALQGK